MKRRGLFKLHKGNIKTQKEFPFQSKNSMINPLGCKVAIASRSLEKLEKASEEMSQIGHVEPVRCNIRSEDDVRYVAISMSLG